MHGRCSGQRLRSTLTSFYEHKFNNFAVTRASRIVKYSYRSCGAVLVLNGHLDVLELANVTVTARRHLHGVLDTSGALEEKQCV